MTSRFLALRVRPANRDIPRDIDGTVAEFGLIAEWPAGKPEPTDYWLSTLPADTPLRELVRLAKIRWRIEKALLDVLDREAEHDADLDRLLAAMPGLHDLVE
ncbi:MAG: hypothetical protein QOG20_6877 [Pseudonocardiales bacterium]|jgi:SRSO17 transposase|nr:hypothetical protein [Pseudonocardiales bacterium]